MQRAPLTATLPRLLYEHLIEFLKGLCCLQSPGALCTSCGLVVVKNPWARAPVQPVRL